MKKIPKKWMRYKNHMQKKKKKNDRKETTQKIKNSKWR